MLQTFTFTGEGRQINAQATYFKYESGGAGGADESVSVRVDGQALGEYYPGDSVRLPVAGVLWEIKPTNAACTGRVRLGVGQVESSRLVGTVKVIDQGADKTASGNQYMHSCSMVAGGAGVWSGAGVVSKTKLAVLKRVLISSGTAGVVQLLRTSGQGTANPNLFAFANKNILGPVSTAFMVGGNFSSATPTAGEIPSWLYWLTLYLPANTPIELPLTTPIILEPTEGIFVSSFVANRDVSLLVDMEEM